MCSRFKAFYCAISEPPDNAKQFYEYISKRSIPFGAPLKYAIFGLGNSEYGGRYQQTGRVLDETFEKLGARKLLPRGEGDSAGGKNVEEQYENWENELWKSLKNLDSTTTTTTMTASAAATSTATESVVETRLLNDETSMQRVYVHPSPALDANEINQVRFYNIIYVSQLENLSLL